MGTVAYYPGCTLKDRSLQLDLSARATAEKLGAELVEVQPWTCCGAVPPTSQERLMNLVAPVRILKRVRDAGEKDLVTICDFCYNVLKRANYRMRTDGVQRTRVNAYLKEDEPLRDYEPAPVTVERPRCGGGIIVKFGGKYAHSIEKGGALPVTGLASPGKNHILYTEFYHLVGVSHIDKSRRTGIGDAEAHSSVLYKQCNIGSS